MVQTLKKNYIINTAGIGRRDYSQNVEYSVEPVIRSWENTYLYYEDNRVIPAGSYVTFDISLTVNTICMLYDICYSVPLNVMVGVRIMGLDANGVAFDIVRKHAYQKVEIQIMKGFPLFNIIQVRLYNWGTDDVTGIFYMAGIYTDEDTYELRGNPSVEVITGV